MHKTIQRVQIALTLAMISLYALAWAVLKDPLVGYSVMAIIAISAVAVTTKRWWAPRLATLVVARVPTKYQTRLWLRDHWKRFLIVVPLTLGAFFALRFWPWGLIGSVVILFLTVTKVISWQRVRKGYGGMEFPGETVLRAERHHWIAFFVFGWEWGKQPKWEAPERPREGDKELASIARGLGWGIRHTGWLAQIGGLLLWRAYRDRRLWPIGYLIATATTLFFGAHENLLGPEIAWWIYPVLGLVWLVGVAVSAIYWWDFWVFVWPAYRVVLTDETVVVVYPVRGALGTIDIAAPEIPLTKIGHWQTTRRALGGGDWDPAFVFGRENVVLRWLRDPEGFKQAAREQLERLEALAWAQRR